MIYTVVHVHCMQDPVVMKSFETEHEATLYREDIRKRLQTDLNKFADPKGLKIIKIPLPTEGVKQ
jgi:hypothetical protein